MAVAEVTASTRMVSVATTTGSTGGATGSGVCSFSVVVLQAANKRTATGNNIRFIRCLFLIYSIFLKYGFREFRQLVFFLPSIQFQFQCRDIVIIDRFNISPPYLAGTVQALDELHNIRFALLELYLRTLQQGIRFRERTGRIITDIFSLLAEHGLQLIDLVVQLAGARFRFRPGNSGIYPRLLRTALLRKEQEREGNTDHPRIQPVQR